MVQQEIDGCAQVTNSCKCLCVVGDLGGFSGKGGSKAKSGVSAVVTTGSEDEREGIESEGRVGD